MPIKDWWKNYPNYYEENGAVYCKPSKNGFQVRAVPAPQSRWKLEKYTYRKWRPLVTQTFLTRDEAVSVMATHSGYIGDNT